MKKTFTKIFSHEKLPFVHLRYSNSNMHYKKHFHEQFSLGVNKKGISQYFNSGKEYVLKQNCLSIMNPNEVHACNASSEVLNEYYIMHLDYNWCTSIQKLINDEVTTFANIPMHIFEDETFYKEYISLCDYLYSDEPIDDKEDALITFFMKFFAQFLDESCEKVVDEKFEAMVAYLEKYYQENISLEQLSQTFDLNEFYIIRLFKSQMNLTPRAYLLNVKINKSKELLQQGLSIVDTALECGFFDQSHFHKNFLKIVATTPKEYQRNFVQ